MSRIIWPIICFIAFIACNSASAQENLPQGFYTGEQNRVRCAVFESGLNCEIDFTDWQPDESEPEDCEFDRIKYVSMNQTGLAEGGWLCVSDTWMHEGIKELPHGQSWKHNNFSCDLTEKRLRCVNAGKHGWELSRKRVKLF